MKIVSLLPSATEIICALGLEDRLVGVTHECDYPAFVRHLPKVTRTLIPQEATSGEIDRLVRERMQDRQALYSLDLPVLKKLQPDLIVTQALCDVCAVAENEVQAAVHDLGGPKVVNLEPQTLSQVIQSHRDVAVAAGIEDRAEDVIAALKARIDLVTQRSRRIADKPRVALLEWLDPPFSSGHWSPEIIELAGGEEVLGRASERSKTLAWEDVIAARPEVILIACCGYDVDRTLQDIPLLNDVPGWHDLPAVQNEEVYIIDGSQYFSRPGPRLVDSLEITAHLLHPDVHPFPEGLPRPVRITKTDVRSFGEEKREPQSG